MGIKTKTVYHSFAAIGHEFIDIFANKERKGAKIYGFSVTQSDAVEMNIFIIESDGKNKPSDFKYDLHQIFQVKHDGAVGKASKEIILPFWIFVHNPLLVLDVGAATEINVIIYYED